MKIGALALASLVLLVGCNKLKSGSGDDGGAEPSGGGGGILSFLSGGPFEGEIALSMQDKKSGKPPMNLVYEVKQPKMRLDLPPDMMAQAGSAKPMGFGGKNMWALVDPPQKKMWVVSDDDKKALVFDMNKMADDAKRFRGGSAPSAPNAPSAPSKPPPKIEKTGKKDKVCGYTCEIWNVTEETKKMEICAAEGIAWFDLRSMGTIDAKTAMLAELTDMNHFPLRVVETENGAETERMEATRCEKKSMADARFTVPPNYQVMDLAQMFQGLGGMGPIPSAAALTAERYAGAVTPSDA